MSGWAETSRAVIQRLALTLPDDLPFKERKQAVYDAYPFGERSNWPYKAWCKARKAYLAKYDPKARSPSPLFPDLRRDPITGRPIIE